MVGMVVLTTGVLSPPKMNLSGWKGLKVMCAVFLISHAFLGWCHFSCGDLVKARNPGPRALGSSPPLALCGGGVWWPPL